MVRQRLSEDQRRQEILEAARKCFLEKGFADTTMEAVIERTTLSKGGVYRYYPSTVQMLADLMKKGTNHRFNILRESWCIHKGDQEAFIDYLVDGLYQKIIDENPYKKLYALFLLEVPKNEELLKLKVGLIQHFFSIFSQEEYSSSELIQVFKNRAFIEFINAMIVGVEMIDMCEIFIQQPDVLKTLIQAYFKKSLNQWMEVDVWIEKINEKNC